nr:protein SMG7 [Ciona intestinalis]|eukprot:XP_018668909.1 protein SMG7 [Ciona intestinalis]
MNACHKLLEQAEVLKKGINGWNGVSDDGSSTGEVVTNRTNLQDVYRKLLITNLEFALDKKTEQDLWNFVFKNHITALQQKLKDKSNAHRTEAQSQLSSFLDSASGFYHQLLHDLCCAFHVNIPCRVRSSKLLLLKDTSLKHGSITHQPERPSCQYMCQHCLVHLGDIARYRNQSGQAESYYRHAAQLVPSNGQPYNQLAILASASGDVLSTAFYYCRSLAVKCPFPGSGTNLRRQLSKILGGDEPRHAKISTSELIKFLLKFHACIYLHKNESELSVMVDRLSGYLHAHLRAGSLSRQQISHMIFLNLFSLHHLSPDGVDASGNPVVSPGGENDNVDEMKPNIRWNAMLMLAMQMLHGLLSCIPVHTDDPGDFEHPGLPAVKLTLDWLVSNASVFQQQEVSNKSRVWHQLAKILNALGSQDKANDMEGRPLPEDYEVRGFIGLKQALNKLDFQAGLDSNMNEDMQHPCRCYRLYKLGLSVAELGGGLLVCSEEEGGTVFESLVPITPGLGVNGEVPEEVEGELEDLEPTTSPGVRTTDPQVRRVVGKGRGTGLEDHPGGMRKKNRAPRMQHVAVQIKPDPKLKAIQEEDTYGCEGINEDGEVDSGSMGSSQESPDPHPRTGHRVTFATPQMSPPQYPPESPSPTYPEQVGVLIPGVFPDNPMQAYPHNMVVPQQMGQMYRHQVAPGNPLLQNQYPRHPMNPSYVYHHPRNMLPRQNPPFQHVHPQRPPNPHNPPPHPADLPKPLFYPPLSNTDNFRTNNPLGVSPSEYVDPMPSVEQSLPRPTDIGLFLRGPPNPQNPTSPNMEMKRMMGAQLAPRFHNDITMAVMQKQMQDLVARNTEMKSAKLAKMNQPSRQDFAAMSQQQLFNMQQGLAGSPYDRDYDLISDPSRGLFKFMTSANLPGGGSNETSSTSSPTPGGGGGQQVSTTTCSPQAGSINNYKGTGAMLAKNPGMEIPRRPNALPTQARNFAPNTPKQLTPTGLGHFTVVDPQPQHGDIYPRDRMGSMFGISPSSNPHLNEEMRFGRTSADQSPTSDHYAQFDRMKNLFTDLPTPSDLSTLTPNTIDPLLHQQSNKDILPDKEGGDSYKLFPDTNNSLFSSQRNRGDLRLSGPGTIGSERAAAQMNSYSPWSNPTAPPVEGKPQERVRGQTQEGPYMSHSFWSTPMVPSGPSALELLIQRQNHVTRDKSPP